MEQKPEAKTEDIKLPNIDEMKVYMDDKTGVAWVGIPTSKMNAIAIMLALDYVKMNLVNWAEITRRTRRPGIITNVRDGISGMMSRLQKS